MTQFGWANPPLCTGGATCGGVDNPFDLYPVQIFALGGGLYGYVSGGGVGLYAGFIGNNPNTPATETVAVSVCMVLNDASDETIGLDSNENEVPLIKSDSSDKVERAAKIVIADRILDRAIKIRSEN